MNRKKVAICFCVRDNDYYLPSIFKNIDRLSTLNFDFIPIFVTDNITDDSIILIKQYKEENPNVIHRNIINHISYRTERIANARNSCIDIVYNELIGIDYHIMCDADDVNEKEWDIKVINNYLNNWDNDNWDSITFNRSEYYDLWALLYDDYMHHVWGFWGENDKLMNIMKSEIKEKLENLQDNSLEVHSSFCGFGIYKSEAYRGIKYKGMYKDVEHLLDPDRTLVICRERHNLKSLTLFPNNEICEHIYYHLMGKKRGLKHKISKILLQ